LELSNAALIKEAKKFHIKKRLGQHFLIDVDTLQLIVTALGASQNDTIVEVGPGIGFLTRLLSRTGARIVAVDLDRESVERLSEMNLAGVDLKQGDFLQFDLNRLAFAKETAAASPAAERFKVVGNVPYQITGLILGHILGEFDAPSPWFNRIDGIVLTVQREVAQRMVAKPGSDDYSKASLLVSYFCEGTIEKIVPPDAFYPPPEVTSAIVRLKPRPEPLVKPRDPRLFKQVIEAGFRQRRKMLRNVLSFAGLPQQRVDAIFKELSFDPQVRAERLSLQQFAMLADAFHEHLKTNAQNKGTGAG
jgi:16S rRNA (adenine1518-N6/adenine1519-N6)-dimethyltransferase